MESVELYCTHQAEDEDVAWQLLPHQPYNRDAHEAVANEGGYHDDEVRNSQEHLQPLHDILLYHADHHLDCVNVNKVLTADNSLTFQEL